MPQITSGSNATFTVPAGYVIDVQCPGGWVQLEYPVGTRIFEGNPAGQTFGPYSGGTAKLTSVKGDIYYEVDPNASGSKPYDPSSVDIRGGVIGGAKVVTLDPSFASGNTALLQSALSTGGLIAVSAAGVYPINGTLTIPSNTELRLAPGVELRAVTGGAGGANTFAILINANANSTPLAISSISAAAYAHYLFRVTVTFAAPHGLSAGGYVQIKGDGKDIYNGIWNISTVPTATTLTFLMSVASGTTNPPPNASLPVSSASQAATVFTTASNTFVIGQPVQITGTPPSGFTAGTVYYVIAANLTATSVSLAQSPTATVGITAGSSTSCNIVPVLQGSAADGNIKLGGGGKINCQFGAGGFTEQGNYQDHAIILRRVLEPVVDGLVFNDVRKYCVALQDVQNPRVRNIHADTGSDGVHVYGPAWNPLVENMTGTYGDDVAVFQTVDDAIYLPFMLGSGFDLGGNIVNGTMREIRPRHASNSGACVFYPNGNTGAAGATNQIYYMLGAFVVDGVSTQDPQSINGLNYMGGQSVNVGNGYVTTVGSIDSLLIRNAYGTIACQNSGANKTITIKKLQVDGLAGDSVYGNNLSINVNYANIDHLSISNSLVQCYGGAAIISAQSNAAIGELNFYNTQFSQLSTGTTTALASNGAAVSVVNAIGCRFGPNTRLLGESTFSATPTISVVGGEGVANYSSLMASTGSTSLNINVNGFKSTSPSNGMFNIYSGTGTITLNISALTYTGSLAANLTGTLILSNPDGSYPIDLSKLNVASCKGMMAKSLAGNGTIVAGNMAISDGTNWRQISDTTKFL